MKYAVLILGLVICVSCGKLKGEFAFKTAQDDNYRRNPRSLEFALEDENQWVFIFEKVTSRHKIGVCMMKKELVWVEVTSSTAVIDPNNNIVSGTLSDCTAGDYQLILMNGEKNEIIDKIYFLIYSREADKTVTE